MRELVVLSCGIALSVAIWLSPGQNQRQHRENNQNLPDRRPSVGQSNAFPTQSPNAVEIDTGQKQQPKHEYLDGWVSEENIADWLMAIITLGGLLIAIRQINEAKRAVWLTERGDVLPRGIACQPTPLQPSTRIRVFFKNYGATRADSVKLEAWMLFADIKEPYGGDQPTMVLAAGEEQPIAFNPITEFMTQQTAEAINSGEDTLRIIARATYLDVFEKAHRTEIEALYSPLRQTFTLVRNEAD